MAVEVESQGFFSRLVGSIAGIGFGLLLLLVGPGLLFWNEGRAVKTAAAIAEGASSAVHVDAETIDPSHDGALVHVNGRAVAPEPVQLGAFGISVDGLAVEQIVEMYQWDEDVDRETKKKLGGKKETVKTYTYEQVWSDDLIDSSKFHEEGHRNPTSMPWQSGEQVAEVVTVGAFTLDDTLKGMLSGSEEVPATEAVLATFNEKNPGRQAVVHQGALYVGDPSTPTIGDVRIRFAQTPEGPVSVLGRQSGGTLGRYETSNGYAVHALAMGTRDMQSMFDSQTSSNNVLTWVLRPLGMGIVFVGFLSLFGPIRVMADVIPFVGQMAGCMIFVVAGFGTIACSLPTIGVAWIFYRPLLGIALLLIGAFFLFLVVGSFAAVAMRSRAQAA